MTRTSRTVAKPALFIYNKSEKTNKSDLLSPYVGEEVESPTATPST
jgi:hypothetical protein